MTVSVISAEFFELCCRVDALLHASVEARVVDGGDVGDLHLYGDDLHLYGGGLHLYGDGFRLYGDDVDEGLCYVEMYYNYYDVVLYYEVLYYATRCCIVTSCFASGCSCCVPDAA